MKNQKYTIDEIVDVQFKKKLFGGLKPADVDEFLNGVIDDYEYFIQMISDLKKTNEELRNESFKIKMNVLKHATNTLDLSKEAELSEASELVEVRKMNEPAAEVVSEPQTFIAPEPTVVPEPVVIPEPTVIPEPVITPEPTVAPEPVVAKAPTTSQVKPVSSIEQVSANLMDDDTLNVSSASVNNTQSTVANNTVNQTNDATAKSEEEIKEELLKLMQEMEALKNN